LFEYHQDSAYDFPRGKHSATEPLTALVRKLKPIVKIGPITMQLTKLFCANYLIYFLNKLHFYRIKEGLKRV
jgi:hypothetical protein